MDKASIVRVVALVIALLNAILNILGYQTIPTEWSEYIAIGVLSVVSLWTAWKNNYLSSKGAKQKEILKKNMLD